LQKPPKPILKTPVAPSTFASRQIEASYNKQSAAVLSTPYKRQAGRSNEPQPSPTLNSVAQFGSESLTDADVEEELGQGLQQLTFETSHSSHLHSDSQSSSGSESCSILSGPHARFYTKPKEAKPRGGANDVWTFFTKLEGRHECILCQSVIFFFVNLSIYVLQTSS
jgi:hypothetical protein